MFVFPRSPSKKDQTSLNTNASSFAGSSISDPVAGDGGKNTEYGCENTTLAIACRPGTVINILRANFGRFSISVCNELGNTTWSVNCMQPRTHRVIKNR